MPPLSPDDCLEARGLPRRDANIAVTQTSVVPAKTRLQLHYLVLHMLDLYYSKTRPRPAPVV